MSTKGDKQRKKIIANTVALQKKITANTVTLKTRVRAGTKESRQTFFFLAEKRNWTTYWFSFFLNIVVPLNLVI